MIFRKFSNAYPLSNVKVGVTANIILGSPKKNCDGIGICRIERAISANPDTESAKLCCKAKALLIEDKGTLVFYFIRHTLTPCVLRKQFIRGVFKVDEVAPIPDDMALELGFPLNSYINRGNYRVVDQGLHLSIAVNISSELRAIAVAN